MRATLLTLLLVLSACGAPPTRENPAEAAARAASAAPVDARLARLYASACRNCHARPDTGAPLVLDHAAWDQRWGQGEDALLSHTVSGFKGMPAGGQCFACTADDYRALIRFMAGREQH